MAENEIKNGSKEAVQLELFDEPAYQVSADPETVKLFRKKSEFILNASSKYPFTFSEIFLRDFIGFVFERKNNEGVDTEPFEEVGSREYLDVWKPQHDQKVERVDYSGYGIWRYNPVVLYRTRKNGNLINKHRVILKGYTGVDSKGLDFIEDRNFCIMSPITYVGRNRYAKNARYLYAFVIDLDGVGEKQLRNVMHQQRTDLMDEKGLITAPHSPMANIIVNSGHGLHMYYLLEHPVALYRENIPLLRKMKEGLTNIVWNEFTSDLADIQYQGIYQGFRLPGTLTKFGERIRAFRNEEAAMHSIASLNGFLSKFKLTDKEVAQLEGKAPYTGSGVTLEEAKRRYPDWYERVIVLGDKMPKKWHIKRDLYDWWLRRLRDMDEHIVQGHRYFCVLMLAIYAMKCDIEKEELERDAYSLIYRMDHVTEDEDNHFTRQDVEDALMGYKLWYCTFPRNSVRFLTGLEIKENRRNGRKQKIHLARIRALQNFDDPEGTWRGRPQGSIKTVDNSKVAERIIKWKQAHPGSKNKAACARDLSLSRTTVTKWWNIIREEVPIQRFLQPINPEYQMALSSDEMLAAMTDPENENYNKIKRIIIPSD